MRYELVDRAGKARLLDEAEVMTGLNRKYLVGLPNRLGPIRKARGRQRGVVYGAKVGRAVRVVAEALDSICAEWLPPALAPMSRHLGDLGELVLSDEEAARGKALYARTSSLVLRRGIQETLDAHGTPRARHDRAAFRPRAAGMVRVRRATGRAATRACSVGDDGSPGRSAKGPADCRHSPWNQDGCCEGSEMLGSRLFVIVVMASLVTGCALLSLLPIGVDIAVGSVAELTATGVAEDSGPPSESPTTERRERPQHRGMQVHVDVAGRYALWLPSHWHRVGTGDGTSAMVFLPDLEDPYTCLTSEAIALPSRVSEGDMPASRERFVASLASLPGIEIEAQDEAVTSTILLL
jgi:hypothetical protein